jgi:FixJ family two-component response regulator
MQWNDARALVVGVVDDDAGMRVALQSLLRARGLATESFGGADELLRLPSIAALACLITDVRMPGTSGLELHRRLLDAGRQVPTIFMTARDDPVVRGRAFAAGALAVFYKPVDEGRLITAVHAAIHLTASRRETEARTACT